MTITSNHIDTVDNGDSYDFKFRFGSDKCTLAADVSEKTFNVKKPDFYLAQAKAAYEAELVGIEAKQIADEAKAADEAKKSEAESED